MFLAWLEQMCTTRAARKSIEADALKPMPERMKDEKGGQVDSVLTHGQMFAAGYATKRWDER